MSLQRLNTGVFCTKEQFEELKKLADTAQVELPADVDKGPIAWPEGPWEALALKCHETALATGLPDIQGFYGIDDLGQFVTYSDVPDDEPCLHNYGVLKCGHMPWCSEYKREKKEDGGEVKG